MHLTKRQKQVFDFVSAYVREHGYAPTLEEIGTHFGLSSPATVYKHIQQLVRKGYLRKARHQGRGIELVGQQPGAGVEAPLVGQLAGAGLEPLASPRTVSVPPQFAPSGRPIYVLRVRGDALHDEHLADGDLLVVEDRREPDEGETVIALLHDRLATIGRYFREGAGVRLRPRYGHRDPVWIPSERLRVQGVLLGLVRSYR